MTSGNHCPRPVVSRLIPPRCACDVAPGAALPPAGALVRDLAPARARERPSSVQVPKTRPRRAACREADAACNAGAAAPRALVRDLAPAGARERPSSVQVPKNGGPETTPVSDSRPSTRTWHTDVRIWVVAGMPSARSVFLSACRKACFADRQPPVRRPVPVPVTHTVRSHQRGTTRRPHGEDHHS